MTPSVLETTLLAKPYFDAEGLIVATENGEVVGFAHAGFGPSENEQGISTELGVTCMLMTRSGEVEPELAEKLLHASEEYLKRRGARVLYAGPTEPLNPFYLGLYGGSEMPGILDSMDGWQSFYREHGYEPVQGIDVLQCDLTRFRPVINRQQIQYRRTMQIEAIYDPQSESWWEACTMGCLERVRFNLLPKGGSEVLGHVTCWNLEPLASTWGKCAAGILSLEVAREHRRRGLATFLLGEALSKLKAERNTLIEAQTIETNTPARGLFGKLGFSPIDHGVVMRKEGRI